MSRKKIEGICSELDCNQPLKARGWCKQHYNKLYKSNSKYKQYGKGLRHHPLYIIWHERKQAGYLCDAWLDFETFVHDVGEKPKNNLLVRLRDDKFGPDNF